MVAKHTINVFNQRFHLNSKFKKKGGGGGGFWWFDLLINETEEGKI